MLASQLRRGLSVGDRQVTRTLPVVKNRAPHVRVYFADGGDVLFRATEEVSAAGYREPFPAGRVASRLRSTRKIRVTDGVWQGEEAGGFHVDFVGRIDAYDIKDRKKK